jgi:putative pyruvate formate lyase activating enzyme
MTPPPLTPTPQNSQEASLEERIAQAQTMLRHCEFCELRCGVDRTRGDSCPCHLGAETYEYKRYVSLHEEAGLSPAMRVFLGGCNFRCKFCDEAPGCFAPRRGTRVDPRQFAHGSRPTLPENVRCLSLIGGEPTLHVHTILAIAEALDGKIPIAVNTNMYMTPEVLDWLEGVVTYYLADFKFGDDACAERLAGVPRYMEVVRRNLRHLAGSSGLTVRHVLLPGHFDCCFRPIVDWLSENLPLVPFQLYSGYVPCWRVSGEADIRRLNTPTEITAAETYLRHAGLRWRTPAPRDLAATDCGDGEQTEVSLTIGADGRLYCHDLTPALLPVLARVVAGGGLVSDEKGER